MGIQVEYNDPYKGKYHSTQYTNKNNIDAETLFDEATYKKRAQYHSEEIEIIADEEYYKECMSLYSNVLNASGINIADPFRANLTHINKMQRRTIDPPYSGKTYIFMTRPDLNFWSKDTGVTNVLSIDLFNYFSRLPIGQDIFPWLMYPNNMRMEFENGGTFYRSNRTRFGTTDILRRNNIFTPFIPMVSNLCQSTSGGKDISLDAMETEGDFYGNRLQYAKGADESFNIGEINLECMDMYGSPLMHLINMWVHYIHYLCKGDVVTWGEYVRYRILDYTCSIYIFMTDKDNMTINRWCKYTGCFPKNVPIGAIQHAIDGNVDQLKNLSLPFAYNRYEAMKPAALADFNYLMNKFLLDDDQTNIKNMIEIGVAPPKLHETELNPTELIQRNKEWYGPTYKNESNNETYYKDASYYDDKFWGLYPYIVDNKLIWIDPRKFFAQS